MNNRLKKFISLTLVLLMFVSTYCELGFISTAAETPKVEIVSFMRGAQKDLRSSELLEARVTGYSGNVRELTYEWTNSLGTYLYIYNSHNMYYIDGTDGEVEIYNDKIPYSNNMVSRTYKDTFSGEGYCWASVYGSYVSGQGQEINISDAYDGTITVTVKDKDGNVIGTDSHTGDVTSSGYWWWTTYSYSGIVPFDLQSDMDDVTIGIFEGDKRNVKDLLGESAIVHITCVESTVDSGRITSGGDHISLTKESGDYYITGTTAGDSTDASGDAKVSLSISKNTCKFHGETSGTATTTVYVFKKPTTSTTAYTLTLTGNLDSRCEYFIDGRQGVKQDDGTILFDGLTPNTQYMVEVRAEYKDENNNTRYTYAYVYDTTKPVYTGTVEVYLDGVYDSSNHTASGEKVNLEDVSDYSKIYAKDVNSDKYIELIKKDTGTYSSILDTGSYHLYYEQSEEAKIDEQYLTMHQADRTRYLFYNSVTYKDGDEVFEKEHHITGNSVNIINDVPQKEGYVFTGWEWIDENGDSHIYEKNALLSDSIGKPYVLTAIWEKGIDVYVNITIDHFAKNNGGHNNEDTKHNVAFDLMSRPVDNSGTVHDYSDVFDSPVEISWDGEDETFVSDTFSADRIYVAEVEDKTVYSSHSPVLENTRSGYDYSIEIAKSGYEIISTTQTVAENGDVTLDVVLRYDPKNADLSFTVELDDESKELVEKYPQYKPSAVHVKVLSWYTKDYEGAEHTLEKDNWHHISQHHDTFVTLTLDENMQATGSYPVWMHNSSKSEYYYYRIKVVSYILENGREIFTTDVEGKKDEQYITMYDRYLATINVKDGDAPINSTLDGAHFNTPDGTQKGEIKGIIHINTHAITFEPDGGKFSDGTTSNKRVDKFIEVPDLTQYTPTRDGGYVFLGWYIVDENGNVTDEQLVAGENLTKDITVRAVWKDPLTVQGKIFVKGYYHLDDNEEEIRFISETTRTHYVTVYLQKTLPNGYTETVDSQKIPVTYNDANNQNIEKPIGTAEYCFTQVPDNTQEYRIVITNPNYTVYYQNEPNSLDAEKINDYESSYNNSDFIAEFGTIEPLVADVNATMEFTPIDFALHYAIDATRIGEGFRPSDTDVLVLSDNSQSGNNPQSWPVITQMKKDGEEFGQNTKLDVSGKGANQYDVWRTKTNGHDLFDYAVKLDKYNINSTSYDFDSATAPFFAYYNGSARYSALENLTPEHQTQLLTIELHPKRYIVTFDIMFNQTETDYVSGMTDYKVLNGDVVTYETGHIWSYKSDISKLVPHRNGYKFLGWYDENDNKVTEIGAEVAQNVTLYAKWEKGFTVTFHANNTDIDYDVFRTYYEYDTDFEESNGNFSLDADSTLDSFYDIPKFEYVTHNKYIFKGWYLDKDNNNDCNPISFDDVYTKDTDIYAHWIDTSTVEKDETDTKLSTYGSTYPGYDLLGVQIRDIEKDSVMHYGTPGSGLRFITVLSEDVYSQINALSTNNKNGAEYGYALAKTATAQKYADSANGYEIQYKGANVNGVNTSTAYKYVSNVKCSGVPDHFNCDGYRLYTAVVTFNSLEGSALETAHSQALLARSYIRYTDANGLLRTHYNNYTGTNVFSGCSASFLDASNLLNN